MFRLWLQWSNIEALMKHQPMGLYGCLFNFEWYVQRSVIIQWEYKYLILWPSTIDFSLVWLLRFMGCFLCDEYGVISNHFDSEIHHSLSMDVCSILSRMFNGASSFNENISTLFCDHLQLIFSGVIVEVHGMFLPWRQWSNIEPLLNSNSSFSLNEYLFDFESYVLLSVIIQRGSQYHILWPSTINFFFGVIVEVRGMFLLWRQWSNIESLLNSKFILFS